MLASVPSAAKPALAARDIPVPRVLAFLVLVGVALLLALLAHSHAQLRVALVEHDQRIQALTGHMAQLEGWAEDIVPMWRQPA